jgi:hypothetical protein
MRKFILKGEKKGVLFMENYPRENWGYALFEKGEKDQPYERRVATIVGLDRLNFNIDRTDPVYDKLLQEAESLIPTFSEDGWVPALTIAI